MLTTISCTATRRMRSLGFGFMTKSQRISLAKSSTCTQPTRALLISHQDSHEIGQAIRHNRIVLTSTRRTTGMEQECDSGSTSKGPPIVTRSATSTRSAPSAATLTPATSTSTVLSSEEFFNTISLTSSGSVPAYAETFTSPSTGSVPMPGFDFSKPTQSSSSSLSTFTFKGLNLSGLNSLVKVWTPLRTLC